MDYPYWSNHVWQLVGLIVVILLPAISGTILMAGHNYNRGRAAVAAAGMSHKAGELSQRAGVNPIAFAYIFVLLYIGYRTFGFLAS